MGGDKFPPQKRAANERVSALCLDFCFSCPLLLCALPCVRFFYQGGEG